MSPVPESGARRAARRRIDWRLGAELLGRGVAIAAVAERLGCSRSHLSRKRRSDPLFRAWMEQVAGSGERDTRSRLADLRRALHDAIEAEVRNGNVRVILWLADRLNLVTPPSERTPEQELRDILGSLSPDELREFEGLRDTP